MTNEIHDVEMDLKKKIILFEHIARKNYLKKEIKKKN